MADKKNDAAPIIIKKVKKGGGDGHHGGAWKVAYADFVTAMMAFFLLMWLINATTETQRKGIADYFKTTIPINRISGGGEGALKGDSAYAEGDLAYSKSGGATNEESQLAGEIRGQGQADAEQRDMREVEQQLRALSGETMKMDRLMRHVSTRLTDEGLVVELFDLESAPLFEAEGAVPGPTLQELVRLVGEVFALTRNDVAVSGYVRSYPITLIDNPVWQLSAARAQAVRGLLSLSPLPEARVQRVSGFADRKPATTDPMAPRNNRIEITLLRRYR